MTDWEGKSIVRWGAGHLPRSAASPIERGSMDFTGSGSIEGLKEVPFG